MSVRLLLSNILTVLILLFGCLPLVASAFEEVVLFESDITPYQDGSFLVEETITYNFGEELRHGIFRTIKKTHQQEASSWYKTRGIDIELQEVTMDDTEVPYQVTDNKEELYLKIGDPNIEISDQHVYRITYKVLGGLSYYDNNSTELYWNATGHDWEAPMRQAVVRVNADSDLLSSQRFCYVGQVGVTDSCNIYATSTYVSFTSSILYPGAGLTIAQELSGGVAKQVVEHSPVWLYWLVGSGIWLLLVGWFGYRYKTAHKPLTTVVSQYEPYDDFKPMFTGVLMDGRLDSHDITAGLVYLAEQGFIKIRKTEQKVLLVFEVNDYEVTLLRDIGEVETTFLKDVLLLLFDYYDSVGKTVKLSKLKADTSKRKKNAQSIQKLKSAMMDDLVQRGYFEQLVTFPTLIIVIVAGLFLVPFTLPIIIAVYSSLAFPLIVVMLGTFIVLGFSYQRRTKKGYEALNHLKGFKEFLSVTDKERFKFHNAPEKNAEQFMRLLPYAIALRVEKEWSSVFKDIQISSPDWYEGQGTFSALALTNDISAFSGSFAGATSSPSSGGSGGGGFSGGGSGGGGGGSW